MLKLSVLAIGLALLFTRDIHAGEKSLYDFLWLDPDKKVYVLQNKLYKKEHTFYADVGYLTNFTSKFQDTSGFQLKSGYYIHEEWAVEIFYNNYWNSNNDEYQNVRSVNSTEPFVRKIKSNAGALAIWSPFYGKINTFNQIFYFDWSFGGGFSQVQTSSNLKSVRVTNAPNNFTNKNYTGAVAKTNVKLHLTERVHVGLEYMNTYYRAPGPRNPKSDKFRTNTDVIMSVGFSF